MVQLEDQMVQLEDQMVQPDTDHEFLWADLEDRQVLLKDSAGSTHTVALRAMDGIYHYWWQGQYHTTNLLAPASSGAMPPAAPPLAGPAMPPAAPPLAGPAMTPAAPPLAEPASSPLDSTALAQQLGEALPQDDSEQTEFHQRALHLQQQLLQCIQARWPDLDMGIGKTPESNSNVQVDPYIREVFTRASQELQTPGSTPGVRFRLVHKQPVEPVQEPGDVVMKDPVAILKRPAALKRPHGQMDLVSKPKYHWMHYASKGYIAVRLTGGGQLGQAKVPNKVAGINAAKVVITLLGKGKLTHHEVGNKLKELVK